ncbi:hypothetical protein Trco_005392 [Trichoderma cornu-damae]|uniref:Uncharacterized protein n=1 Tax=Trichoderma cornu-damae TaxID=654480 RepID=A0A9P8QJC2_9HYPO|nr:hypothetical protein Trco_005392 [Trichoderma cornu-damae]
MLLEVKKETRISQPATQTRRNSATQIESRGKAQELATLEDYSETKIESHVEAALKEMLQIKRRLEASGGLSEAHAADSNNPAIQISSHVAKALKEMSKIKESLEAKRELKAKKAKTIITALDEASLSKPDVRLVIAYPRAATEYPQGKFVIPLKKTLDSKDFFAVIQSKEEVGYTFSLPYYDGSSRCIRDQFHIIYNPQSDDCVVEITTASKFKYSLAKSNTKLHLSSGKRQTIRPGVWSILVEGDIHRSSIDILLLKRCFNISICDANSASLKREAADYIRATKRPRNEGLGTYVVSHAASVLPMQFGVNTHNRITPKIVDKAIATITDLRDGHTAVIRSQTEAYHLQRKHKIFENDATHTFSCELSTVPGKIIAAKVLRNNTSTASITAAMWKQEKTTLKMLNHIEKQNYGIKSIHSLARLHDFLGNCICIYETELLRKLIESPEDTTNDERPGRYTTSRFHVQKDQDAVMENQPPTTTSPTTPTTTSPTTTRTISLIQRNQSSIASINTIMPKRDRIVQEDIVVSGTLAREEGLEPSSPSIPLSSNNALTEDTTKDSEGKNQALYRPLKEFTQEARQKVKKFFSVKVPDKTEVEVIDLLQDVENEGEWESGLKLLSEIESARGIMDWGSIKYAIAAMRFTKWHESQVILTI